jgi:hypothetical protein
VIFRLWRFACNDFYAIEIGCRWAFVEREQRVPGKRAEIKHLNRELQCLA